MMNRSKGYQNNSLREEPVLFRGKISQECDCQASLDNNWPTLENIHSDTQRGEIYNTVIGPFRVCQDTVTRKGIPLNARAC